MSVQTQKMTTIEPGATLMGRYVIESCLGSGGMGKVYLARQHPFNRPVVIKVMHQRHVADESLRQRFYNEAQAASRLSHPNTITVYDFGESDAGVHFIAMEYVDGRSLHEELSRSGPMPIDRAVPLILQVAQSLGEAHRKSVIHRDLKLENIMVSEVGSGDEFAKVLDFGIAKLTEKKAGLTQTGSVFGTPGYMPPEQADGRSDLDATADLYALTCCLYELLTGRLPFEGESALSVLMKHQTEPVPDLPAGYPRSLNAFIKRGMAKDRAERPASADDYIAELLACFIDEPRRMHRATPRSGRQAVASRHAVSAAANTQDAGILRTRDGSGRNPHDRPTIESPIPSPRSSAGSRPSSQPRSSQPRSSQPRSSQPRSSQPRSSQPRSNRLSLPSPDSIQQRSIDDLPAPGRSLTPSDTGADTGADAGQAHRGPANTGTTGTEPGMAGQDSRPPSRGSGPRYRPPSGVDSSVSWTGTAPPAPARNVPLSWVVAGVAVIVAAGAVFFALSRPAEPTAGSAAGPPAEQAATGAQTSNAATAADEAIEVELDIESSPAQASVFADGQRVGTTPTTLTFESESTVDLRVEKQGYLTETFANYKVGTSAEAKLIVPLRRATITLEVNSPLDGGELIVNGTSYGKLPAERARTVQFSWPDDALELRIRHPDHSDYVERIPGGALSTEMTFAPQRADFVESSE